MAFTNLFYIFFAQFLTLLFDFVRGIFQIP